MWRKIKEKQIIEEILVTLGMLTGLLFLFVARFMALLGLILFVIFLPVFVWEFIKALI